MPQPPSLRRVCLIASLLLLFLWIPLNGQEADPAADELTVDAVEVDEMEGVTESNNPTNETIYQPRTSAPEQETIIGEHAFEPRPTSLLTKLGAWIFGLAVFCACLVYFKKKGFFGGVGNTYGPKQLEVLETTALGSKQFLVLARARNKEILLGVGPGFISKLETLGNGEDALPSADALSDEFSDTRQEGGSL